MLKVSLLRRVAVLAGVAVLATALSACGSSSSSTSSHHAVSGLRGHIYHLKLTGKAETPPGAPNGSGEAVIAFHHSLKVCWRFSRLRGFTDATFAHIHRGAAGKSGPIVIPLSTSSSLHHKGCVKAAEALLKTIEKDPHGYYVNIHSRSHPAGAVRSQL